MTFGLSDNVRASAEKARIIIKRLANRELFSYKPYPKQAEFHAAGRSFPERMLSAGSQDGKAQPDDTLVLTPGGWCAISALNAGDLVISGSGEPVKIMGVFPQGVLPISRLTFDDGRSTRCCDQHLWKTAIKRERYPRGSEAWNVQSLAAIRKRCGDRPSASMRPIVPYVGTVKFTSSAVSLDPYLVGLLIGDGCFRGGGVSISTGDSEILESIKSVLPDDVELHKRNDFDYALAFVGEQRVVVGGAFRNPIIETIAGFGLLGLKSYQKFVPKEYLWNDPNVRLGVLQGLMDSDGSVTKVGQIEFSTTSLQLAEDVEFLVMSFGGKSKRKERRTFYYYENEKRLGRISYRLWVRLPHVELFRLSRKLERCKRPVSTSDHNVLWSIEPVGKAECTCIAVEGDGTYVTEDFIVTHNTYCGSREAAMHLTGRYPDWWEGRVFDHPTVGWTGSVTNETSRDVVQEALLGASNFASKDHSGSGAIPGEYILDITKRQAGVPNVADQIFVRHKSGGISQCSLKTYQQEDTTWTGKPVDFIWSDEGPPKAIYSEMQARIMAADEGEGGIIFMTYTPVKGMTAVTGLFWEPAKGSSQRKLVVMTIYDAEHYTDEQRERKIQAWEPYERECRAMGVPMMGEGLIWPVPDEEIVFDLADFPDGMPRWFARIAGCDFGIDHPGAGAWAAHDRDQDIVYLYDCYKKEGETAVYHAEAFKTRDPRDFIPVAWPHDGLERDKGTGKPLKDTYRKHGVNMMRDSARYDNKIGGPQSVETINQEIHERMKTGRFKVARHLLEFFAEKRMYHRKDGKVVKLNDDIISAVRYLMMELRKAKTYVSISPRKPRYTRPIVGGP